MKIERISDNQIRCTLTKADLEERNIRLTELAYGTEKAKQLFREMMMKAYRECGWTNEGNIPLMIEAIPLSGESIVLVITKVEDPEELDTRFSRFTPDLKDDVDTTDKSASRISNYGADDVIDLVKRLHDTIQTANKALKNEGNTAALPDITIADDGPDSASREKNIQITVPVDIIKLYSFNDMNRIIELSHILKGYYEGQNTLYRDSEEGNYYLIVRKSSLTPERFNKVCNIITEYAEVEEYTPSVQAYFDEHVTPVIENDALQVLAEV